jgi:hypothetical protein
LAFLLNDAQVKKHIPDVCVDATILSSVDVLAQYISDGVRDTYDAAFNNTLTCMKCKSSSKDFTVPQNNALSGGQSQGNCHLTAGIDCNNGHLNVIVDYGYDWQRKSIDSIDCDDEATFKDTHLIQNYCSLDQLIEPAYACGTARIGCNCEEFNPYSFSASASYITAEITTGRGRNTKTQLVSQEVSDDGTATISNTTYSDIQVDPTCQSNDQFLFMSDGKFTRTTETRSGEFVPATYAVPAAEIPLSKSVTDSGTEWQGTGSTRIIDCETGQCYSKIAQYSVQLFKCKAYIDLIFTLPGRSVTSDNISPIWNEFYEDVSTAYTHLIGCIDCSNPDAFRLNPLGIKTTEQCEQWRDYYQKKVNDGLTFIFEQKKHGSNWAHTQTGQNANMDVGVVKNTSSNATVIYEGFMAYGSKLETDSENTINTIRSAINVWYTAYAPFIGDPNQNSQAIYKDFDEAAKAYCNNGNNQQFGSEDFVNPFCSGPTPYFMDITLNFMENFIAQYDSIFEGISGLNTIATYQDDSKKPSTKQCGASHTITISFILDGKTAMNDLPKGQCIFAKFPESFDGADSDQDSDCMSLSNDVDGLNEDSIIVLSACGSE